MKKGDYYKWKAGKKVWKFPWVIRYYESITDENQYDHGKIVNRNIFIVFSIIIFILYGLLVFTNV